MTLGAVKNAWRCLGLFHCDRMIKPQFKASPSDSADCDFGEPKGKILCQ